MKVPTKKKRATKGSAKSADEDFESSDLGDKFMPSRIRADEE